MTRKLSGFLLQMSSSMISDRFAGVGILFAFKCLMTPCTRVSCRGACNFAPVVAMSQDYEPLRRLMSDSEVMEAAIAEALEREG